MIFRCIFIEGDDDVKKRTVNIIFVVLMLVMGLLLGRNYLSSDEDMTITLYFPDMEGMSVVAEQRVIDAVSPEQLPDVLVEALIAGPENSQLFPPIPEGTRLLPVEAASPKILVKDGVAYVNFSKEMQQNHPGGSTGEVMTVASVVNTLTELDNIEAVQFLIEGEVLESIWGHGITNEPIMRMPDLIRD